MSYADAPTHSDGAPREVGDIQPRDRYRSHVNTYFYATLFLAVLAAGVLGALFFGGEQAADPTGPQVFTPEARD